MRCRLGTVVTLLVAAIAAPQVAHGRSISPDALFIERARAMMSELRRESRRDARRIAEAYGDRGSGPFTTGGAFEDRAALVSATESGAVAALPLDEGRFNIRPRLTGAHPIGEKDLRHQALYVGARPATLGLLLHVASRVRSTPLEVTSLVRHQEYQRALRQTNPNARTRVPTHALGVAFDISILNVPLAAAREIRDVLRHMRDEGDLFFIAETRQLVFHVVLAPGREPFYDAVFAVLASTPAPRRALAPPLPPGPPSGPVLHVLDEAAYEPAMAATLFASGRVAYAGYATVVLWLALVRTRRARAAFSSAWRGRRDIFE